MSAPAQKQAAHGVEHDDAHAVVLRQRLKGAADERNQRFVKGVAHVGAVERQAHHATRIARLQQGFGVVDGIGQARHRVLSCALGVLAALHDHEAIGHKSQRGVAGVGCRVAAAGVVVRERSRLVHVHALRRLMDRATPARRDSCTVRSM